MLTDIDIQKLTQSLSAVFATKEDLKGFATKDDLKNFATKEDFAEIKSTMVTKDDLHEVKNIMATKELVEQTKDVLLEEMIAMFKLLGESKEEYETIFKHVSKMTHVSNNHEQRLRSLEEWKHTNTTI